MSTTTPTNTLIRLPDVIEMTGLSRASIYRRIATGTFPKQVKLSESNTRQASMGFYLNEVQAWVDARKKDSAVA